MIGTILIGIAFGMVISTKVEEVELKRKEVMLKIEKNKLLSRINDKLETISYSTFKGNVG